MDAEAGIGDTATTGAAIATEELAALVGALAAEPATALAAAPGGGTFGKGCRQIQTATNATDSTVPKTSAPMRTRLNCRGPQTAGDPGAISTRRGTVAPARASRIAAVNR